LEALLFTGSEPERGVPDPISRTAEVAARSALAAVDACTAEFERFGWRGRVLCMCLVFVCFFVFAFCVK
jgi:hypothetical protein